MKYATLFLIAFFVLSFNSCKEEPVKDSVSLPTNLQVTVSVSDDVEGLVEVTASADKANFYTFIFSDNNDDIIEENNEGEASYQFSEEGTYQIEVRANTSQISYINQIETVTISFEDNTPGPGFIPTSGYSTPLTYPNYNLVWNDEFEGNALSTADWNYEIGTGSNGWGNNELQYYTDENTRIEDGYLIIEAKQELTNGSNYSSSRVTTQNKQSFKYGRIDIRAALPYGQGIWPALWMLGNDISSVGWPDCGEIDIMELVGGDVSGGGDNVVHGTVHWDNGGTYANYGQSNTLSDGIFANEFHVFSIVWNEQSITWYRDDIQYNVIDISPANMSEFDQEFFFIFNVAVGGNWPGSPNSETEFPQTMIVDYVRVFQPQ